jgi:hypothetical protein
VVLHDGHSVGAVPRGRGTCRSVKGLGTEREGVLGILGLFVSQRQDCRDRMEG